MTNMNTYLNPIKRQGDFADPFVMRYNGRYYLYATNPDIRCWSSEDLLDWKAEGPSIGPNEFPGLVPFAPEVVYCNGAFYMYTSPSGFGHYVLKSDSPTGPFCKITGNVGHNIDGSVFIDDDGQWYFYWADDAGILCCKMDAPDSFGEPVNTGAFLHGWTEGPMIVKEGGLYYMTYTGNHYLSPGYRIHAAVSEHPQGPYRDCENNPILIHTTGKNIGLGHSSTVLGPDLATRYIVYHNMNPDLTRDLDLDVIELKDGQVQVAGPSRTQQPAPALPAARYDPRLEGFAAEWTVTEGAWKRDGDFFISREGAFKCMGKSPLLPMGAVECNLLADAEQYGVTLGRLTLRFDAAANEVLLLGPKGDVLKKSVLPGGYAHQTLHCVLLCYTAETLEAYLDGRRLFDASAAAGLSEALGFFAQGGRIGLGCCTVSAAARGSARLCFPVPCRVRADKTLSLNVPEEGEYILTVLAREIGGDTALTYLCNGRESVCGHVRRSRDCAAYPLVLPQGRCELALRFGPEVCGPVWCSFHRGGESGRFSGALSLPETVGKAVADMPEVSDFTASLSIAALLQAPGAEAGLLFRASELAKGGEGEDERLGINFFIGYCASLKDGCLVLTKHRYDSRELARVPAKMCCDITVQAVLNDIKVFLNGEEEPILSFHDPDPILYGRVGVRAVDGVLKNAYLEVK